MRKAEKLKQKNIRQKLENNSHNIQKVIKNLNGNKNGKININRKIKDRK